MTGFVYMLASQKNGTIYTGVTGDLARRIPQHKEGTGSRFTAKYGVVRLVWYEEHFDIRDAIDREKAIKRWRRDWKIAMIEQMNPGWEELFRGTGWRGVAGRCACTRSHCRGGEAWVPDSCPLAGASVHLPG